jgi:hypothetical protein
VESAALFALSVVGLHPRPIPPHALLLSLVIKVINRTSPSYSLPLERCRKCEIHKLAHPYFMNMQLERHLYNVGCQINRFAQPQQYTVIDIHVPIVSLLHEVRWHWLTSGKQGEPTKQSKTSLKSSKLEKWLENLDVMTEGQPNNTKGRLRLLTHKWDPAAKGESADCNLVFPLKDERLLRLLLSRMRLPNNYIHTFGRRQNVPVLVSTICNGPEHRICETAQYALVMFFTDILKVLYAKVLISRIPSLVWHCPMTLPQKAL